MKIKPVSKYRTPQYPTIHAVQQDQAILSRIPQRWRNSPVFATLLGIITGLSARSLSGETAADADSAKPVSTQAPAVPKPVQNDVNAAGKVQKATAVVAPLLEDALMFDGRGAFGCVAINPPTFLSEEEAVEIIKKELESAGLKFTESVDLDNVESPTAGRTPWESGDDEDTVTEKTAASFSGRGKPIKLKAQDYTFDLADTGRSIYIEYLSSKDHEQWQGHSWSTVSSYNFPELAERVVDSFKKRQSDKKTVFGVFFDPLARAELPSPNITGLTSSQSKLVRKEHNKAWNQEHKNLSEKSKDKLRKQVQNFAAFLKSEGIIGKQL